MGEWWDRGRNHTDFGNKWKWTQDSWKPMGHSIGRPEREIHGDTGLPKKDGNISKKQPNTTPRRTGGTRKKTQSK